MSEYKKCPLCDTDLLTSLEEHLDLEKAPFDDDAMWSMSHPLLYQRVWKCSCGALFFHDDPYSDHRYYDCPDRVTDESLAVGDMTYPAEHIVCRCDYCTGRDY